jgi:hypothetical protein
MTRKQRLCFETKSRSNPQRPKARVPDLLGVLPSLAREKRGVGGMVCTVMQALAGEERRGGHDLYCNESPCRLSCPMSIMGWVSLVLIHIVSYRKSFHV